MYQDGNLIAVYRMIPYVKFLLLCVENEDALPMGELEDSCGERQDDVQETRFKLTPIPSESSPWQEEIVLNWNKVVVRDDLLGLRNFFKQGMTVNVVEEKVSY